ncbi:MAG TPA: subclass B3 metallo-beta-lactamase [Croceibacterium sp.]
MFARMLSAALLLAATAAAAQTPPAAADAQAQWARQCKDWDGWDKAGPPFRIWGNAYYVGTCGISAVLITGSAGDILIDGGPPDAGDLIAANIKQLGIPLANVRILLHTHEHYDHVGGLARLKELTGARLYASPMAAQALRRGTPNPEDPQYADHHPLPAVRVDKVLEGNVNTVALGNLTLKGFATPGHTPGALSWQWQSCEGDDCKTIVYADSLTPVSSDGYKFTDHPDVVAEFNNSLVRVASLQCDILLSPHPSASGLRDRLLHGKLAGKGECLDYANDLKHQLDARLAKEVNGG